MTSNLCCLTLSLSLTHTWNAFSRPPSVTASDITQYEDIDDDSVSLDLTGGDDIINKMRNRPLPAPPRPPRDKKQHKPKSSRRDDDNDKFDRGGGAERLAAPYLDDSSRISSQDIDETEAATQTDPLPTDFSFEEFEITDDLPRITPSRDVTRSPRTIDDLLREHQAAEMERIRQLESEQALAKSISKFRDANQRRTSERSRTSGGSRGSRPITPSAMVIESRIIVSTDQTDAALLVAPIYEAENRPLDYRTDSKESEDVPYLDDNVTTEDERLVNEAIRRYQLLDTQFKGSSSLPSASSSRHDLDLNLETTEAAAEPEVPLPPPRRKSSGGDAAVSAEPATPSTQVAKIEDTQVPTEQTVPIRGGRLHIDELDVNLLNVRALQAGQILVSELQGASITTEDLQCRSGNITVRGIELPIEFIQSLVDSSTARAAEIVNALHTPPTPTADDVPVQPTWMHGTTETKPVAPQSTDESKYKYTVPPSTPAATDGGADPEPPARPPPPQGFFPSDFAPYSTVPPSFYQLRNRDSDEEMLRLQAANAAHRRPRRHHRRQDSTSEEEYQRDRRHRREHEAQSPEHQPSILDLSGQLVRACGSAIGNTLHTASDSIVNLLTSDPTDEKRKNVNLVLIILVIILAVLLMLGLGDSRAVHHHHWDFLNPPKNSGL